VKRSLRRGVFVKCERKCHRVTRRNRAGIGFDPETRLTSQAETISAAIWRFEAGSTYELQGPANRSNVISMPVVGEFHHTYFGDGRQKWSRMHAAFTTNLVSAGEQPRGVFVSSRRIALMHVYLPQSIVEGLAVETGAAAAGQPITLIDPMCAPDPDIERIGRQIVREMESPDRCARLMLDAFGQALAIGLLRNHSNVSRALVVKHAWNPRDWRLRRAIDYLEAHLADDVGLHDVATEVGLSITHLTALFRDGTGEPPHRYLMRRRFERACELLADTSISISDIAYQCGFANPQHLATVVRRHLSMTPTAYRRQLSS
jgi:AraC family transcriptional regulator